MIDETLDVAIRLMISTGLRVGEVCRLRVEDISPDGFLLRVHGKGSRDRVAYVSDTTLRTDLSKIFKRRRIDAGSSAALFLNRRGFPIRPQSIRSKLRKVRGMPALHVESHLICSGTRQRLSLSKPESIFGLSNVYLAMPASQPPRFTPTFPMKLCGRLLSARTYLGS